MGYVVIEAKRTSKCIKLALKEYMTRYDWVGNVIHWELCKKIKLDHTNKSYMHNRMRRHISMGI